MKKIWLLSLIMLLNFNCNKNAKSVEGNNEPYLYDVPPAPPFKEAEAVISISELDGCMVSDRNMVGYIISNEKDNGNEYTLVQDEDGVRHKCYIDTDLTSNYDKSWLKYILIPGNKVDMKFQICGNGGFIDVMKLTNLKRE